jgi:O-antigen/teichoic acid export membrane protein
MNDAAIDMKIKGMATTARFVKNWAYLLGSSVFCQILGMIAILRVARVLAPTGYGLYSLVLTTASIGLVFAGFGMRNVIIRDCARYPENTRSLFSVSLSLRAIIGVIAGLGIILYATLSKSSLPAPLGVFAVIILSSQIVWDTAESISFGRQRMEFSSWINTAGSLFWVLWVWVVPASVLTIEVVSISFALLQVAKAGAFIWKIKLIIPSAPSLDKRSAKKNARYLMIESLPFFWLALLTMLTNQLPILLLAERSNPEQVGLFNVGFRLLNPLQLLIITGLSVLYPYLSQAKDRENAKYMRAIESALKMTVLIGSGCAFLITLFRVEIVKILFGADYAGSADAMVFQCWYTVLYAILCLIGTSLGASNKQKWLAALSTAYTLIVMPIIWFGASYGATGLAAAMAIGALINLSYHWYVFQRSLPGRFPRRDIIISIIIFGCAVLGSWLTAANNSLIIKAILMIVVLLAMAIFILKEWARVNSLSAI